MTGWKRLPDVVALGKRAQKLRMPRVGEVNASNDMLGDGIGDDCRSFVTDDSSRGLLDRRNHGWGVRRIGLARPWAHAAGDGPDWEGGGECIDSRSRRGDRDDRYGEAEHARTFGGGFEVAEQHEGADAAVATLAPGLERDLQSDAGRVAHADRERQRPSLVRLLPHHRYSMWAS